MQIIMDWFDKGVNTAQGTSDTDISDTESAIRVPGALLIDHHDNWQYSQRRIFHTTEFGLHENKVQHDSYI